ncbi:hypothetical protein LC612_42635 [Nostoc sp. CHAB 5834]|nr:hypothetical protein [Nostoc sp. CHAB 5834]
MKKTLFLTVFALLTSTKLLAQGDVRLIAADNTLAIKDSALAAVITKYVKKISSKEMPIIVFDRRKDSTFCYVSALFNLSSLVRNLPSSIIQINNRDALVYMGSEAWIGIDTKTKNNLLATYKKILVDDLTVDGTRRRPNAPIYTYDPVWVKITLVNNKICDINDRGQALRTVPFFKYGFD